MPKTSRQVEVGSAIRAIGKGRHSKGVVMALWENESGSSNAYGQLEYRCEFNKGTHVVNASTVKLLPGHTRGKRGEWKEKTQ